jgi:hypothetical protein
MLFKRASRSNPEVGYVVAKNSWSTASLSNGQVVVWDWTTDCDGVGVTAGIATTNVSCGVDVAGVAAETIAHEAYGLIQCYGYHSATRVRTMTDTSHAYHESRAAVAKGTPLVGGITASAFCAEGITPAESAQVLHPFAIALAAQSAYTTAAIAVFIKAL